MISNAKKARHARFLVWRDDFDPDDAKQYAGTVPTEAALAAAADDHRISGWEWSWPVVYHVRDTETDAVWLVEVGREHVPRFYPESVVPIDMAPAVHVLWGSRVVCEDLRLRSMPSSWPAGQSWVSLPDIASARQSADIVTCKRCYSRTPGLVAALRQIGALNG